ncbi:hypothetical protein DL89DRAFT_127884 [Linderina pennispora]|uniref:Uncharacterized protein n=1 Tax=Linderina pennispora TaxID=61395 RepID=A0A1Y1WDR2_9FUNG|nr:uncharacterized protein DL89DRAFT_127884 [Linderina pennispora]ORX71525.1 hypothetical protein DL89DRAFT_127884 [Linderina pennispora]
MKHLFARSFSTSLGPSCRSIRTRSTRLPARRSRHRQCRACPRQWQRSHLEPQRMLPDRTSSGGSRTAAPRSSQRNFVENPDFTARIQKVLEKHAHEDPVLQAQAAFPEVGLDEYR